MRSLRVLIIICFFLPFLLQGKAYFVKLTPAGLKKRSELVGLVPSTSALHKQTSVRLKAVLDVPGAPSLFLPWLQMEINTNQDKAYLQSLKAQGLIASVEPVGYFKLKSISRDSLVDQQWYLPAIGMPQAWQMSEGDSSVIVAIIDTGVDYLHPDLAPNIWHNQAEVHGKPGVDDDGNGYVDDVIGWDFTDAPRFPDGGDYLQPDPDPMDEFSGGHGTEVAGIIAAVRNNQIGISGIAPKVKIMVLRAGTASGYLEEDDVIRAMIYALNNGAKIINMSFGDTQVSALFHDVVHYLHSKGVILVAAAGNDGSPEVNYPAGFDETIAVGASNQNEWLASFSNYGPLLDVIAPGVDILSTAPGNAYNTVNGTSFSAPMVSATAALIISQHPEFSNEQVRTVLKGSAKKLAQGTMDAKTGAGQVSAFRALKIKKSGALQILQPAEQASISTNDYPVVVTAFHPDLQTISLTYGLGQNPAQWQPLASSDYHYYFADTIAFLPCQILPDTTLTLHLSMQLLDGSKIELLRSLRIDRSPPKILVLKQVPAYEGTQSLLLIDVKTDDPTALEGSFTVSGDTLRQVFYVQSAFLKDHFIRLTPQMVFEGAKIRLHFTNSAGLSTTQTLTVHFPAEPRLESWQAMGAVLPAGYLLPKTTDLNNNGQQEIVLSKYGVAGTYGPVYIYEFLNGHFVERWHSHGVYIPRDAGDVNGDGRQELLLSFGSYARLIGSDADGHFPDQTIWQDSSFWAAAITDLDGDGKGEIVGYRDSVYQVLEWNGADHFRKIATLPNPSAGTNRLGVPFVSTGDFNGDGLQDIAYGDYDGDVIVYTCSGNDQFKFLAMGRGDQSDATDLIAMRSGALYLLSHTSDDKNFESQWERRYWSLNTLNLSEPKTTLSSSFISAFYPFYPKKNFGSALKFWTFAGQDFLFTGLYPYLYLLRREGQHWQSIWVEDHFNSNAVLLSDFNQDGIPECYFNDGQAIVGYALQNVQRPSPPVNLQARPLDSLRIRLRWDGTAANGFLIYRGLTSHDLQPLARSYQNVFVDSTIPQMGRYFYYRVTAFDSMADYTESLPSNIDSAKTDYAPRLVKAWQQNQTQILLEFDQAMALDPQRPAEIILGNSNLKARSVVVITPKNHLLATFPAPIPYTTKEKLLVRNVFNVSGVPLDSRFNTLFITCNQNLVRPYVKSIQIDGRYKIALTFNVPMDEKSLTDLSHYRLTPAGFVKSVAILDKDCLRIELQLSQQSMAGGFGQSAYLIIQNLKSQAQVEMEKAQTISLIRPVHDLNQLTIYPQPVRPEHNQLIFAKLPQNTQIQIFTLNGKRIRSFHAVNQSGGVIWDLRDEEGHRVGSGVYFYRVECAGEQRIGKLVIVR